MLHIRPLSITCTEVGTVLLPPPDLVHFHVWLYSNDSMLNGFARIVFLVGDVIAVVVVVTLSLLSGMSSILSRIDEVSCSSSVSSPTTSMGESSSSRSDSDFSLCWAKYSAFSVSTSTVMPFARNFRACRSNALFSFFRRRDLRERKRRKSRRS